MKNKNRKGDKWLKEPDPEEGSPRPPRLATTSPIAIPRSRHQLLVTRTTKTIQISHLELQRTTQKTTYGNLVHEELLIRRQGGKQFLFLVLLWLLLFTFARKTNGLNKEDDIDVGKRGKRQDKKTTNRSEREEAKEKKGRGEN
ncbi:UNVERIFIED_CONTAM: hypothetical protein Sindi_2804700 [Sesamum indicum]